MKPAGRTLAEFQPLKLGEQKLLDACRKGEFCRLGNTRPEQATDDNTVRAAFVRFLALGGDEKAPVHEHGVQLWGAWLDGTLDLEGSQVVANLALPNCEFARQPVLRGARIRGGLFLNGSRLPGLTADRLVCEGSVFLNNGFSATGGVRLLGAQIGGNLSCDGATLDSKEGDALVADGAAIKGGVFLSKGFSATGDVRLLGAQIGGNLECIGAKFDGREGDALSADGAVIKGDVFLNKGFSATGTVRLPGTQIGGNLECDGAKFDGKEGDALSADGMRVAGGFFLRDMPQPVQGVSLNHAQVGRLADDKGAWGERLVLDGFAYGSLAGGAHGCRHPHCLAGQTIEICCGTGWRRRWFSPAALAAVAEGVARDGSCGRCAAGGDCVRAPAVPRRADRADARPLGQAAF